MEQTSDAELRRLILGYLRLGLVWIPIMVGGVHQIVMFLAWLLGSDDGVWDRIPVFLNPPGHLEPLVTLEYQWWLVLTLITFALYLLIANRRLPHIHKRVAVPFYTYLLFLLVFVKPI